MKRKLKQKSELIGRLLLIAITLFTNFAGIMPVLANSYSKGEVIDSVNSKGSIENEGDVKVTKTVEKEGDNGTYRIKLNVQGKDKVTTESKTAPIYSVVVLDNSGSMDNCSLCIFSENKYSNAKKGTKSFARTLLSKYSSAQLALVTFSTNARVTRDFQNSNFDNVTFPSPNGLTYLSDGILAAKNLLDSKKQENPNAKLYMVILTDGYPEEENISSAVAAQKAKEASTNAKGNGIEIFTIGYDTNTDTRNLLKEIATDNSHFSEANEKSIVDKFNDIAGNITVNVPAGTNAQLTDIIGDEFTYVENSKSSEDIKINGKEVTIDVKDITASKEYSFLVKINKDAEKGLHQTNNSCILTYDNISGNNTSLGLDTFAKVYWEPEEYNYTINYYKDSINSENLLNTINNKAKLNTKIYLTDENINKFKPIGYKDGVVKTDMPYIITDGTNIINIVYSVKDNLSYTVEYYKEKDKVSKDEDNTFNNKLFGEKITEEEINKDKYLSFGYKNGYIQTIMPYTIIDGSNIIKVCYEKRNDMTYTVKYLEKGTNNSIIDDKKVTNRTYNEIYKEDAKQAPYGYVLSDEVSKEIKVDTNNKELVFYYEKAKKEYTVRYVEEETNNEIAPSVKKEGNLIDPVTEKAINVNGYNLVSDDEITIVLSERIENEIVFYYERKDVNYTVKYLDNETKEEISNSIIKKAKYLDEVTEKAISIDGYNLVSFNEITIKLNESNNEIIFYYEKNKETVIEVVKTGINDDNNNYLLLTLLFGTLTSLGYVIKKRFD